MDPLALACAAAVESRPLRAQLSGIEPLGLTTVAAWRGSLGVRPVILVECGMGKTNASHSLTVLLERESVSGVIGFGVAGAYPGSELAVGDLALADGEHYGDEGVETPEGWMSCEGIGIPLWEASGERHFNSFPVDPTRLHAAVEALADAGTPAKVGPFVTVSCCSGTTIRGIELASRYGALCETMEGAAYAHVAAIYQRPYVAVRGVSNRVEDREESGWDLSLGARVSADAVGIVVRAWEGT